MDGRAKRSLKEWSIAIGVPFALVAAWLSYTNINQQSDRNRLEVVCEIEKQNITQLTALRRIARELGLPGDFEIPEVTPTCAELSP